MEKFQTSLQYQPRWVPESIEMPPNKNRNRELIPKIPGFQIPGFQDSTITGFHDSRLLGRMADFHFIYYIPIKTYNYIIKQQLPQVEYISDTPLHIRLPKSTLWSVNNGLLLVLLHCTMYLLRKQGRLTILKFLSHPDCTKFILMA